MSRYYFREMQVSLRSKRVSNVFKVLWTDYAITFFKKDVDQQNHVKNIDRKDNACKKKESQMNDSLSYVYIAFFVENWLL